jgi:hypothetical protein
MASPVEQAKPSPCTDFAWAIADWACTDGLAYVYIFKTVLATLLAIPIAMRPELPQPRTAMTTVFIVTLPANGHGLGGELLSVLRNAGRTRRHASINRAFFAARSAVSFVVGEMDWTLHRGAAPNRQFKSYGFVLAGLTAALVGIPTAQQPDGTFVSAMTRAAEVCVGIVCLGMVSGTHIPAVCRRADPSTGYPCRVDIPAGERMAKRQNDDHYDRSDPCGRLVLRHGWTPLVPASSWAASEMDAKIRCSAAAEPLSRTGTQKFDSLAI